MKTFIKIHPSDSVAVALAPLPAGTALQVAGQTVTLLEDIPQGHKFALTDIPRGEAVIKYGAPIGAAQADIPAGGWVHTHNVKTGLGDVLDYSYQPDSVPLVPTDDALFQGYRREDGRAAVRNEVWIIPTVGCVNDVARAIERLSQGFKTGTVDGIYAFPHPYGCSQMGEDQENTRKILAGLIHHPNAGGVLVLGLGCENSNIDVLKPYIGQYNENRVKFLVCQDSEDEIADGVALVEELAAYAGRFRREPISCGELVVGMKCGGSDGLSGITANPTVGAFSDLLISKGGTTVLTEVPEMFGAESILFERCRDEAVFRKAVKMIEDFKGYFTSHNQVVYENPSPGNKAGGITTLEDKSCGCVQKGGSAQIVDVLDYGGAVTKKGLNLLSGPGNDLVSATALTAAGAHLILFTTGRGTPFGAPAPTVKISTNTPLFEKKGNWIDFNAGVLAEEGNMEEETKELFDYVTEVASGRKVCSEEAGYHDMAIFKQGVTL